MSCEAALANPPSSSPLRSTVKFVSHASPGIVSVSSRRTGSGWSPRSSNSRRVASSRRARSTSARRRSARCTSGASRAILASSAARARRSLTKLTVGIAAPIARVKRATAAVAAIGQGNGRGRRSSGRRLAGRAFRSPRWSATARAGRLTSSATDRPAGGSIPKRTGSASTSRAGGGRPSNTISAISLRSLSGRAASVRRISASSARPRSGASGTGKARLATIRPWTTTASSASLASSHSTMRPRPA